MKPIWIVLGLIGLYLYSKGQLGSSIQATFPVATTLLTDVTGSTPQPNQKAIAGNGFVPCTQKYPGYSPGQFVNFGSTAEGSFLPPCVAI